MSHFLRKPSHKGEFSSGNIVDDKEKKNTTFVRYCRSMVRYFPPICARRVSCFFL